MRLADMRRAALILLLASSAAQAQSPFLPPAAPAPKLVKVLAPPDFIDRAMVEAFEKQSGATVALDQYAGAAELSARSAEDRYDLVVLRGPALARRLAAGSLTKLDRRRLPNARLVQPAVAAKYAAYDRDASYGVPYGWTAFGLIYDADKAREPPVSFAQALGLVKDRRNGACGVVWPDAHEETFLAIWKVQGVDAARAKPADVKSAAAILERARNSFLVFAAPDEVGAFAKGAACLGAGTAGEAAAAVARGGDIAPQVRFAWPREGAPLAIYAFAIPSDAASPDAAYRFLDAALAPETARRAAAAAGVNGAQEPTDLDQLKRLTPEPALDPAVATAMQAEWKRLAATK
jgi:putrescine transport system substrate-binding protein